MDLFYHCFEVMTSFKKNLQEKTAAIKTTVSIKRPPSPQIKAQSKKKSMNISSSRINTSYKTCKIITV